MHAPPHVGGRGGGVGICITITQVEQV